MLIERSVLVQVSDVADDASDRIDAMAARFRTEPDQLAATPFVLIGSVAQVVDELERLRERIGVNHVVVREAEGFAPVVDALRGR